ncbi:MAG: alkaline phosphatase PhoX [Gammaproteobacteria bacterium]
MVNFSKRRFLKQGLRGLQVCGIGAVWSNLLIGCSHTPDGSRLQKLQAADENGVRLPIGFRCRVVAVSSQPVLNKNFMWHAAPDGGACFETDSGGWIYVSNSEMSTSGGVGAIAFDSAGEVVDAYSILKGTRENCSGGATPWGSWLSCEEVADGQVWECHPDGKTPAQVRPALGVFTHEAVAVDEKNMLLYLTEDKKDGCLYRFKADRLSSEGYADLTAGVLEVAVVKDVQTVELDWVRIPDPQARQQATRHQVPSAMKFNGGEGIAYFDGKIIFTTKGDNRVWSYDTQSQQLDILYDANHSLTPILTDVDNITVSAAGDIYVAEDRGDLQIVVIDNQGYLYPIVQLEGHGGSEVAGLAFSPDGRRLYFSSQRGKSGLSEDGITFEVQGF